MDLAPKDGTELTRFDVAGLTSHLVTGRQDDADALVDAWIERGCRYGDIALRGIRPALDRVGELWAAGQATVAQEHLATAMAHRLLVRALDGTPFDAPREASAVFACVEGNHHALGLRMVGDAFAIAGWQVAYLGANVPTADLVAYAASQRPDLVGLSVSMPSHIEIAVEAVARLRGTSAGEGPSIVIGGRPLAELADHDVLHPARVWTGDDLDRLARA